MGEYLVAVKSSHEGHECGRDDCPVRLSAALTLPPSSALPAAYTMLCEHQVKELRRTYCRLHCKHNRMHTARLLPPQPALPLVCNTCGEPGQSRGNIDDTPLQYRSGKTLTGKTLAVQGAQLLNAVRSMVGEVCEEPDGDGDGTGADSTGYDCPEQEYKHVLHLLAAAMAQHSRSRSTDEILDFIGDEAISATKRVHTEHGTDPHAKSLT